MPQIWWLKVQIRAMAKKLGVKNTFGLDKTNLIRKVQVAEGNFPCFRTAESTCSQSNCLWLEDCIGRSAANRELSRQAAG
jgi:hypothetical protein